MQQGNLQQSNVLQENIWQESGKQEHVQQAHLHKGNVQPVNGADIQQLMGTVNRIENEIAKHIVGQKNVVRDVVICILAGGNVLLEGVPGLGKTRLVRTIGRVLDLNFSRIQFTPDLMPADVVGTNIITKDENGNSEFRFQTGPIFSNIVLADEINRATPKTQSALLEAMQEQTVTVGGRTHRLVQPFFVLATQNPIEMEGTYPLPEAQMDRFLFKLDVKFPNLEELMQIVDMTTGSDEEPINKVSNGPEIMRMREIVKEIPIARPVQEYALKLVLATHPESENAPAVTKKYLRFGSSPRGAQAIILTAKIRAVLEGRLNVAFEDIRYVAYPALRHRIFPNFEAATAGVGTDQIIEEVIKTLQ